MRTFKDIYISTDIQDLSRKEQLAPQLAYMLLCTAGEVQMQYAGRLRTLKKDDLLFSPANRVPTEVRPSEDFACTIFGIEISKLDDILYACLSEEKAWIGKIQYIMNHPVLHLSPQQTDLLQAYRVLVRFYSEEDTHYQKRIVFLQGQAIILELLSWVDAVMLPFEQLPRFSENQELGTDYRRNQLFLRFRQLVDLSYAEHHDVKWYAEQMNISTGYLNAVCKWTVNKSPTQVISDVVVQMAKRRLQGSHESIKQIAFSLSFGNEGSFGKFFRKQTGQTPSDYRKQYFKTEKK